MSRVFKNNINRNLSIFALVAIIISGLGFPPLLTKAQSLSNLNTSSSSSSINQNVKFTNLHNKALKEIDKRVKNINDVLVRIPDLKKISDEQKHFIIISLNSEITLLQTLKTKIFSDQQFDQLTKDVKSLVTEYKTYSIILTDSYLTITVDRITEANFKIQDLSEKLNILILKEKNSGKDITNLDKLNNDLMLRIKNTNTQINNSLTVILSIKIQDYFNSKTQLIITKEEIKQAFTNLKESREYIKQITNELESMKQKENLPLKTIITPSSTSSSSNTSTSFLSR